MASTTVEMAKPSTSTAIVETKCNKCWFPFQKAYEKRLERKLKTVNTAPTTESYDPPRFDAFSVSIRQEDSVSEGIDPATAGAADGATTLAERKIGPFVYSGGALEWEAFEEAVAQLTDQRCESSSAAEEGEGGGGGGGGGGVSIRGVGSGGSVGSVRSEPPPTTKTDHEEGWNFPSWFPSLGTKHLPPNAAAVAVAAARSADDSSVVSATSVFDGVSVDSRTRVCSPVASFAEAASLGVAPSNEEDSIATKSQRTTGSKSHLSETKSNLSETKSHLSETKSNLSETKSHLSETKSHLSETKSHYSDTKSHHSDNKSHYSDTKSHISEAKSNISDAKSQFSDSKSQRTTGSSKPQRESTGKVANTVRSIFKSPIKNADEKHVAVADKIDAFAVVIQEEKKDEDDDEVSVKKSYIRNQNSWSSVSVNSRMDASSVLKSLSYSFSQASSASSGSGKLPVPPAINRSKAAAAVVTGVNNETKDAYISQPPVLTSDRQLALQPKVVPYRDTSAATAKAANTPTATTSSAANKALLLHHVSMADEISEEEESHEGSSAAFTTGEDRYIIRLAQSEAESTVYSEMYSDGYSESSRSENSDSVEFSVDTNSYSKASISRASRSRASRKVMQLPAPKEEEQELSFEALEVQEEDFLKRRDEAQQQQRTTTRRKSGSRSSLFRRISRNTVTDDDDNDDRVDEADDELDDSDEDDDDDDDEDSADSTDNEGVSFISLGEDDEDDDDEEDDNPAPSIGQELSEMAQELTRGGPGVLMDWLALRTSS